MNLSYHVAGLFAYQRNYCSVFVGYVILLYGYHDFALYEKIISLSCAVKILFLSYTCEDIGVAMVTNINFDFLEQKR